MTQWIARLLGRRKTKLECVNTLGQDGLEVRINRLRRGCGHDGHLLEVFFHPENKDRSVCIAVVPSTHVHVLAALLTESARYLDRVNTGRFAHVLEDD